MPSKKVNYKAVLRHQGFVQHFLLQPADKIEKTHNPLSPHQRILE